MKPSDLTYRPLLRSELADIWRIDRSEVIERIYHHENGTLVLKDERYDLAGWPPGEVESSAARLLDCFERGGSFFGAFSACTLVGLSVLENRFIGESRDQLQLKFLHVGRAYRGSGLGRSLFQKAVDKARELGARGLYISATPSEHTVHFYQSLGCQLASHPEDSLFALEPDDIHLLLRL